MKNLICVLFVLFNIEILRAKLLTQDQLAELPVNDADVSSKLLDGRLPYPENASSLKKSFLSKINPDNDVLFFLYTRNKNIAYQLKIGDIKRLNASDFDFSLQTKIAIHGYAKSYLNKTVQLTKEAYLQSNDLNFIGVDWSVLAEFPWYFWAANNTRVVGQQIAKLVDWLVSEGANIEDFHLIGHSLGAHVAGFAANYVTSGKIPRITGLDPAYPMFGLPLQPPSKRLDPTDADVVECIHTCGGYLGFYKPLGTHDFYPNGGTFPQLGCPWDIFGKCSHRRSILLFAESINSVFKARRCGTMEELKNRMCNNGTEVVMSDPAISSFRPPGIYYLTTNAQSPFVVPVD